MPKRILNDKYELTLSGDELRKVLSLVRRDLSAIPAEREWLETSVWESRQRLLNSIEEKIVISYNTSGTEEVA